MRGGGRIELRDASRAEVARVTAHRWSQAWCMGPHRGRISQSRAMRCIAPGSARTAWSALVSRVVCGHSWGRSCGALASSPPWSVSVSCLVKSQTTNTTCSQIEIRKQTLRLYVIDMVIVYGPRSRTATGPSHEHGLALGRGSGRGMKNGKAQTQTRMITQLSCSTVIQFTFYHAFYHATVYSVRLCRVRI